MILPFTIHTYNYIYSYKHTYIVMLYIIHFDVYMLYYTF